MNPPAEDGGKAESQESSYHCFLVCARDVDVGLAERIWPQWLKCRVTDGGHFWLL